MCSEFELLVPGVSCALTRALYAHGELWGPGHLFSVRQASGVGVSLSSSVSSCVLGMNTCVLGVRCGVCRCDQYKDFCGPSSQGWAALYAFWV